MLVTDMIWNGNGPHPIDVTDDVTLLELLPGEREAVLTLVGDNAPQFSEFYEKRPESTRVYGIERDGQLVGAVLIEERPRAAESPKDGALGALVVAKQLNGQGVGSAAIVRCCDILAERGFDRVIAEWVASVPLYKRLGFEVWKHREIAGEGPPMTSEKQMTDPFEQFGK